VVFVVAAVAAVGLPYEGGYLPLDPSPELLLLLEFIELNFSAS
jgi:hypothetical protein